MDETEWRCRHCGKFLGVLRDGRLHLRFARGHEYLVGFPTTGVCRGCRTLNEFSVPTADDGRKKRLCLLPAAMSYGF